MYPHLSVILKPSRYLLAWLIVLFIWVVCLVFWVTLPAEYFYVGVITRMVVLIAIAWFVVNILKRDYFLKKGDSILAIHYHHEQWQLELTNGDQIAVTLRGDSVVWYELMVLGFDIPHQRKRFVVIFADSCDNNTQRQLRVQLRLLSKRQVPESVWQTLKQWMSV